MLTKVSDPGYRPYHPQQTVIAVANDLWIVDGPEVNYRFAGLTLPCPTRMTIARLAGGKLWLHSPTHYTHALGAQLATLGDVTWLVAPNSFHYAHIAAWSAQFPAAEVHLSPDVASKIGGTLPRLIHLSTAVPGGWTADMDQSFVDLGGFVEAVFFHKPSRSLIVTDLLQNFERDRIVRRLTRLVLTMGGATGPTGTTSLDIRLLARGHHAAVREAVAKMVGWAPDRIILSHGKCFEKGAVEELHRAFAWVGDR